MYDKQKQNATCRKHKRAKRVMTPRNRMRKRKQKRITSYSVKPSKIHLSYSRKKHRKLRTKTIKRYRKRLSFEDSSAKVIGGFSGFSEEELLKGIIVFANNTPDMKNVFKDNSNVFMPTQYDYNSADDFKNIKSLPLLMSIYSVIIKPEFISESTSVNSVIEPVPAKPKDGIHLTLAIKVRNSDKHKIEKEIPNTILLKFVISKIREIERTNPHPDLLNTFLYFFDIIDFPSALAMVNLYLNKLYELTKGKDMSFDQITTYLEKNLAHHSSVEDWKAAFDAITDPDEKNKMLLKYTSVINSIDKYERANSELNALFYSAWAPFDISNEERNLITITNTDKSKPGIQYQAVSTETAKEFRSKSPSSKKYSSASEVPEIPYTPGKVWWVSESEKANYQVVPNGGNGDCYFLSIAQALNEFNNKTAGFFDFLNDKINVFIDHKINRIPKEKYKVLNRNDSKTNIDGLTAVIPSNTVHKFDYEIKGDITVANMRSLLVLYYFSDGFVNKYVQGIMTGKIISENTPNAGLNDINESFKGFDLQVAVLQGIQSNVSRILSNTYFAEETSISILQELLWFQTIALSNSLQVGIIATTHYVPDSNFVVYIIVNYTNNIHYELINYIQNNGKNTVSTFKYPDLPPLIQRIYTDMVNTSSERHDDNVWILKNPEQEGLNVSASYNTKVDAVNKLLSSSTTLKIKDIVPSNNFIFITEKKPIPSSP